MEPCLCGDPFCGRCFPQTAHWRAPMWKTKTIKKRKGQKKRAERKVVTSVRAECVKRDGYCRVRRDGFLVGDCEGKSEWAHLPSHRRSKTRGQEPERRHTTAGSCMLCQKHHDQLDGRRLPRILVTGLDDADADTMLAWTLREV